jgi:hypothetical protein
MERERKEKETLRRLPCPPFIQNLTCNVTLMDCDPRWWCAVNLRWQDPGIAIITLLHFV